MLTLAHLWAIARFDLQLTDTEFGKLTPRLFDLLLKRKEQADKKEWRQVGTIAAAVINFSMCHPDKVLSPEDFVPGIKEEKEDFDLRKLAPEDQAKYVLGQFSKKTYNRRGSR